MRKSFVHHGPAHWQGRPHLHGFMNGCESAADQELYVPVESPS